MKTHDPDWTSLVAGLTFGGIAIAYLTSDLMHRSLELRWVAPVVLIGLGLAGLAGTIMRLRISSPAPTEAAEPTPADDRAS